MAAAGTQNAEGSRQQPTKLSINVSFEPEEKLEPMIPDNQFMTEAIVRAAVAGHTQVLRGAQAGCGIVLLWARLVSR